MWNYERRLQYPVNITSPNAKIAQIILSQYGGPDGEAAARFVTCRSATACGSEGGGAADRYWHRGAGTS